MEIYYHFYTFMEILVPNKQQRVKSIRNYSIMVVVNEVKYQSILNRRETEKAIDLIKTSFSQSLSDKLNLFKLSCPLVILDGTRSEERRVGKEHRYQL